LKSYLPCNYINKQHGMFDAIGDGESLLKHTVTFQLIETAAGNGFAGLGSPHLYQHTVNGYAVI